MAPAPAPDDPTWQEQLRASGHRLTPQRELVLAAVQELAHATPDEVYAEVRRHSSAINLSTIYRTLELLDELGLIRHAHIKDRAPTYHSALGHTHFHLVCRGCQQVTSVDADRLDPWRREMLEELGFRIDVGHLTVFGTCAACTAVEAGNPVAADAVPPA